MERSGVKRPVKKQLVAVRKQQVVTKSQVRQMIKSSETKQELKMVDVNGNALGIDFSGTLQAISNIAQGDQSNTRDGDEIELDHLEIRWNFGAADATNLVRLMVIQYYPSATPFVTSFLQNTGSGAAPISQLKRDDLDDYSVLFDTGPVNLVLTMANTQKSGVALHIKPRKRNQRFNQAATTGANQLYLLTISDSGAVAHPTVSYNMRLYYYDA